jgi:hypothetical protein
MAANSYKRLQNFIKYSKLFVIGLIAILGSIIIIYGIYIIIQNNKINDFDKQINSSISKIHQDLSKPGISYLNTIHDQDQQNLVLIRNGLYPLYGDLFEFIDNKVNNNSTSSKLLSELNLTKMKIAESRDSIPPGLNKTLYGLDRNDELDKRNILHELLNTYSKEHAESLTNNLIYSFMATPKCGMYIMEPYSPRQVDLSKGFYPDHPWCSEFNSNPVGTAYATEPYYANTAQHKVSTVIMPVTNESKSVVYFLAGTLNIHEYIDKMLYSSKDLDPSNTKVMLLVKHGMSNPILYEPWFENQSNIHQNTSFSIANDKIIIDNIDEYSKNKSSNWRSFKIGSSNYIITAATSNQDNNYLYPIDANRNRGVTWEWVILRNIPDPNTVPVSQGANPFTNSFSENTYLFVLMILLLVGISLCAIIIKKYFTKTNSVLIDLAQLGNATNQLNQPNRSTKSVEDNTQDLSANQDNKSKRKTKGGGVD